MSVVVPDEAAQPGSSPRVARVLRRWAGTRSESPPAVPDSSVETSADLIADIVQMTGQAAIDGLPLSAVLDDLRLVLQLDPADVLPVGAVRACALEWARASGDLETAPPLAPVTLDDLDDHIWRLLGSSPEHLPGRVVVVRLRSSAPDEDAEGPRAVDVLDPADLLWAAVRVMATVFDRPGEHVALLRSPPAAAAERAVALVPGPGVGDGPGDEDRMALFRASLASAPLIGVAAWVVEIHDLDGHPSGLLASIREALGPA